MLAYLLLIVTIIAAIRVYMNILRFVLRYGRGQPIAAVVVMGDIGRSPRMQNHAVSLTQNGYKTLIFGYHESTPIQEITNNKNIKIININQLFPAKKSILIYIFKSLWLHLSLFASMCAHLRHHVIIVQNPPSIPSLAVVAGISVLNGAPVVVDWHNYGHTILACSTRSRFLVKVYHFYEYYFGGLGSRHLCVSKSMGADLGTNWGICAQVLYDRPPNRLISSPVVKKEDLRSFFVEKYGFSDSILSSESLILVSSTSWTADEDFSILLDAFDVYEKTAQKTTIPHVFCFITGKGPLKDWYLKIAHSRGYKHVSITAVWLEAEDYPLMLRAADIGVSLHTSSSGLDLPMKVVDMLAARLVVLSFYYPCIEELVVDDCNGFTFRDYSELAGLIIDIARDVECCRNKLVFGFESSWEGQWNQVVLPLVDALSIQTF